MISSGLNGKVPLPPPYGANFFHLTRMLDELQLLVGSVNLIQMHEALAETGDSIVPPMITHRFTLSMFGFQRLRDAVNQMGQALDEMAAAAATAKDGNK
jgi:pyruvate dehydrogenase complex dehydrogenase (E1) component